MQLKKLVMGLSGAGLVGVVTLASIPAGTTACTVTTSQCSPFGTSCNADGECCSSYCGIRAGICCAAGTAGNPDGTPCNTDSDCCTAFCATDGLCGCIGANDTSTSCTPGAGDCCSGLTCNPGNGLCN